MKSGKGKSGMEQNTTLDAWAKYGADQYKVCLSGTWGAGFRPVIAGVYVKLFPALIRNLLQREVLWGAWPGEGMHFVPLWSLKVPCWTMFIPSFCESSSYSGVPCVLTGSFLFSLQNEVNLELKTRQETRP